ncbi:MAG: sigma-54 dependent transcriptional regulator [Bacteroidota bacterium]
MAKKDGRILIVDDEETFRYMLTSLIEAEGYTANAAADGVQGINSVQAKAFDVALLDVKMPKVDGVEVLKFIKEYSPDTEAIMVTAVGDVRLAVECMKLGAYDYITKPFSTEELLGTIDRALERKRLLRENILMKKELSRFVGSSEIIGKSAVFQKVLEVAARVAPTESTILIQGASGTGKELVANFIFKNSSRAANPFVALNCASIPDSLIESELFGHEKGAFTDAKAMKQGLVEIANGGTLFLDEVGDISLMVQPKLLRFVQTGEFRRVGGNKVLKSDVRIISATNKDLSQEVRTGRFREDLLYRLNVITIEIPPLQTRLEDIPLLVDWFLKNKLKTKTQVQINPKALEVLMKYDWPGNVRELENVIERAAILCGDNMIQPHDLSLPLKATMLSSSLKDEDVLGGPIPMREIERLHIQGVLKNSEGSKSKTAKILGISLKTLYNKINQFQIKDGQ